MKKIMVLLFLFSLNQSFSSDGILCSIYNTRYNSSIDRSDIILDKNVFLKSKNIFGTLVYPVVENYNLKNEIPKSNKFYNFFEKLEVGASGERNSNGQTYFIIALKESTLDKNSDEIKRGYSLFSKSKKERTGPDSLTVDYTSGDDSLRVECYSTKR